MCRKILWPERRERILVDLANHGGKYELLGDGAGYTGAFSKITLFCREHGAFSATAASIKKKVLGALGVEKNLHQANSENLRAM